MSLHFMFHFPVSVVRPPLPPPPQELKLGWSEVDLQWVQFMKSLCPQSFRAKHGLATSHSEILNVLKAQFFQNWILNPPWRKLEFSFFIYFYLLFLFIFCFKVSFRIQPKLHSIPVFQVSIKYHTSVSFTLCQHGSDPSLFQECWTLLFYQYATYSLKYKFFLNVWMNMTACNLIFSINWFPPLCWQK